ncbi:MAG: S49 family peptidase [Patescibacteria group bacterium]
MQTTNPHNLKNDIIRQQVVVKPKAGGFLWSFIIFSIPSFLSGLVWLIISVIVMIAVIVGVSEGGSQSSAGDLSLNILQKSSSSEGILVYDIKGPIISGGDELSSINRSLGSYTDIVKSDFESIKNNPDIKNIVFRVNTPGGELYASEILGDLINELLISKNQSQGVFFFEQIAASGGLWATYKNLNNYVVGSPYGQTGSIGVILTLPDLTGLAEKVGYSENVIKSSDSKDIGNPLREITSEERAYFQEEVDAKYDRFLNLVAVGRRLEKDDVRTVADGRTFENSEAVDLGLIDETGDLDVAIEKAASNTNLGKEYKVWTVENETGFIDSLLQSTNLSKLMGIPENATKAIDRATFLDPGVIYLIDEYRI